MYHKEAVMPATTKYALVSDFNLLVIIRRGKFLHRVNSVDTRIFGHIHVDIMT